MGFQAHFFFYCLVFTFNFKTMSVEIVQIIDAISHEKGINRLILINAIEAAVLGAERKRHHPDLELSVVFNEATGETQLFLLKEVVTTVKNPDLEIALKDAKKVDKEAKKGGKVRLPGQTEALGRIAALNAKQLILQRVREAESDTLYNSYKDKINEVVSGIVLRQERRDIIIDLGKIEGILPKREQVPSEKFKRNDRVRAYVLDIKRSPKGVYALLSRTHPGLLIRLFETEVPEISEGIIEIKAVAREPSGRSKIAVCSREKDVDPVGACVGIRGVRVQSIVNELRGEKIDIVEWSDDPTVFVAHALSPAKISRVNIRSAEHSMEVIVQDDQLSLAIGKRGQNVRLASSLIKWRIDIKGEKELRREIEERESKAQADKENLVAALGVMEGMEKTEVALLLEKGLSSFQKIVVAGLEKLLELGFAEEKAQAILELCQTALKEEREREPEEAAPAPEAQRTETSEQPLTPAELGKPEEIVENIEEFSIDALSDIAKPVIELLKSAEYQTIAEVCGAEIEELVAEGLTTEEAEELHRKAMEFLEQHEKA